VQAELAPDVHVETPQILAWNERGRLDVSRVWGTMRDGGRFENVFLRLMAVRDGRIYRYEVFDVGDPARAHARFAELCA
jgi:ketosteroid isomerase-like protein